MNDLLLALERVVKILDDIGGYLTPEEQTHLRFARNVMVTARASVPAEPKVSEG